MKRTEILEQLKTFVLSLSKEPEVETPVEEVEVKAVVEEVEVKLAEEVPAEEAPKEEPETPKYVTVEEFAQLVAVVEELKTLVSGSEEAEMKVEELKKENVELSKQLDEKPDAAKVVHSPEVKEVELKTVESRFLNLIRKNK